MGLLTGWGTHFGGCLCFLHDLGMVSIKLLGSCVVTTNDLKFTAKFRGICTASAVSSSDSALWMHTRCKVKHGRATDDNIPLRCSRMLCTGFHALRPQNYTPQREASQRACKAPLRRYRIIHDRSHHSESLQHALYALLHPSVALVPLTRLVSSMSL